MPNLSGVLVGVTSDASIHLDDIKLEKADGTNLVDEVDTLMEDVDERVQESEIAVLKDDDVLRAQRAKAISNTTAQEIEMDSNKSFPTNRDGVLEVVIWNENASFVKVPLTQDFRVGDLLDKTEATAGQSLLDSDILPLRDIKILDTDGTDRGYINLGYATVLGETVFVITSTDSIVQTRDIAINYKEEGRIYGGRATSVNGTLRLPWRQGENRGIDALPVGTEAPQASGRIIPPGVIWSQASVTIAAGDENKAIADSAATKLPILDTPVHLWVGGLDAGNIRSSLIRVLPPVSAGAVLTPTNSRQIILNGVTYRVGHLSNAVPVWSAGTAGTYESVEIQLEARHTTERPSTTYLDYSYTFSASNQNKFLPAAPDRIVIPETGTANFYETGELLFEVDIASVRAKTASSVDATATDANSVAITHTSITYRFGHDATNHLLVATSYNTGNKSFVVKEKPEHYGSSVPEPINVSFDETLTYAVNTDGVFHTDPEASPIIPNRSYNIFDGDDRVSNITWHQLQNTSRSAKSTSGSPVASTLSNSISIETDQDYSIRIGYYAENDEDYFQCALISDDPNAKASHVGVSVALRLETAPVTDVTDLNFEHYFDQELTKNADVSVDSDGNIVYAFSESALNATLQAQIDKLKTLMAYAYQATADVPSSQLPFPTVETITTPDQLGNTNKYVYLGFVTQSVSYQKETYHPGDAIIKVGADAYKLFPDGRARTLDLPTVSTDFTPVGEIDIARVDARVRFVVETIGSLQNRYARYGLGLGSVLNTNGISVTELNSELIALNFSMQTGDLDIYTSNDSDPVRFWLDGTAIELDGVGVRQGTGGSVPWGSQPTVRFYRFGLSETYMDNNLDHDVNIEFRDGSFLVGNPHSELAKIPVDVFRAKIQEALFSVGTAPPTNPVMNELWESSVDQTLATFTSEDGSDATQAYSGDTFRWNGTRWVRIESQRSYRPILEATLGNHDRFPVDKMPLPIVLPDGQVPDASGYDLGGRYQINSRPAELLANAPQTVATNDLNNLEVTIKAQGTPNINSFEASNPTAGDHNSNRFCDYLRQEHARVVAVAIAVTTPNASAWRSAANATIQVKFNNEANVTFNRQITPPYQKGGVTYQRYAPSGATTIPTGKVNVRFFDAAGNPINFRDDRIYDAHEFVEVALRGEAVLKDQNIAPVLDVSGDPDDVYFGVSQHTNPQRDDFLIDMPAYLWRGVREQVPLQGNVINREVPLLIGNTNFDNGLYFARDFNQATGVAGHAVFYMDEERQQELGILKVHISLSGEDRSAEVVYDLSRHNNALGHFTGLITSRQIDAKHQPETSASPGVPRNMTWRVNFETADGSFIKMTKDSVQNRREKNPGKFANLVRIFYLTQREFEEIPNGPNNRWHPINSSRSGIDNILTRDDIEPGMLLVAALKLRTRRKVWSRPFAGDEWLDMTSSGTPNFNNFIDLTDGAYRDSHTTVGSYRMTNQDIGYFQFSFQPTGQRLFQFGTPGTSAYNNNGSDQEFELYAYGAGNFKS